MHRTRPKVMGLRIICNTIYIYVFVVLPFVYIILSRFLFHFYIFRGVRVRHIAYGLLYTADYTYTLYIIILYIALFHLSPTRLYSPRRRRRRLYDDDMIKYHFGVRTHVFIHYNILYLPIYHHYFGNPFFFFFFLTHTI